MNDELLARLESTQGEISDAVKAATTQQAEFVTRLDGLEAAVKGHADEKKAWDQERSILLERIDKLENTPAAPRPNSTPVLSTAHLDQKAVERVFGGMADLDAEGGPTTAELEAQFRALLSPSDAEKECMARKDESGAQALRYERVVAINMVKQVLAERNSPLVQ